MSRRKRWEANTQPSPTTGMNRKKSKRYLERDEKVRDTFKQALKRRVFIDESGLDETLEQDYGRTEKYTLSLHDALPINRKSVV